MADFIDPRMSSVQPRIRYNTIGGINGPLVVLDNVSIFLLWSIFCPSASPVAVCHDHQPNLLLN